MESIKTIIADDHGIFLEGLRVMLEAHPGISVVAQAKNGEELVEMVKNNDVDVVLTDISMPIMDGIEATKKILAIKPSIGIIALSMHDEDNIIIELLEAGGKGYLLKNADKHEVWEAIGTVHNKMPYYSKSISDKMIRKIARSYHDLQIFSSKPEFTEREIEIIGLICKELTNKEIADELNISMRTVEGHRLKILEKVGVKNTVGLVVYALKHKIYIP
jgi:DNA-binding NarL/FixJ family response regulator